MYKLLNFRLLFSGQKHFYTNKKLVPFFHISQNDKFTWLDLVSISEAHRPSIKVKKILKNYKKKCFIELNEFCLNESDLPEVIQNLNQSYIPT